jgi:hypothetical protein
VSAEADGVKLMISSCEAGNELAVGAAGVDVVKERLNVQGVFVTLFSMESGERKKKFNKHE